MDCNCKNEKRIDTLEDTVFGNGKPGLKETSIRQSEILNRLDISVDKLGTAISGFHKFQNELIGKEKTKKQITVILTTSISIVMGLIAVIVSILIK